MRVVVVGVRIVVVWLVGGVVVGMCFVVERMLAVPVALLPLGVVLYNKIIVEKERRHELKGEGNGEEEKKRRKKKDERRKGKAFT